MNRGKNKELIRQFGMNPQKPDSFQAVNEPMMNNLLLWSQEHIDLSDIIQSFFNVKVKTKITAILLDLDLNNWIGIGASWQHNNQSGIIRIDTKFTEFLLNSAFGESNLNQPFNIKKINQLELNILQSFLDKLEIKMKEFYEIDSKHPFSTDLIYLVWLVESQDQGEIGRIAFGIPASFRPKKAAKPEVKDVTDINKLANTGIKVPVDFIVGKTRLTFNEIKTLEFGDLILFEDSDVGKFKWQLGEIGLVLPEEGHAIYLKEIDNVEQIEKEMVKTKHTDEDPLSSLPLELSAEFQKVSIPLKQVLELKAGGVLPLGSVLDTELTLCAQGKPVAKGELVIIGNQFGIRISDLLIGAKRLGKGSSIEIEDVLSTKGQPKKEEAGSFSEELENLEG